MGMKIADLDKTATTPLQDVTQDIRTHTRNTVAEVTFDVKSPKTSRPPSAKSEGHTPVASPDPGQQKKMTRADSLVSAIELPARSLAQSSLALHTEEDYQQSLREERKRIEQQTLKR